MINAFREWFAFHLLEWALKVLPVSSSTREGMLRGLKEQREYDRYYAYCQMFKVAAFPFHKWREHQQFLYTKASNAEQANAALKAAGRPAWRPAVSRL